jgi:hypothetical protein
MGRIKDLAYRPFERQRYKGYTTPEYVESGRWFPDENPVIGPAKAPAPPPPPPVAMNINNGFYAPLAPRDKVFVDFTDEWDFNLATLQLGIVTIAEHTVPDGMAWYIDNLYFFARAVGGLAGNVLLGPSALYTTIALRCFVSSSQLKYAAFPATAADGIITTFPFLNDRVGSREAEFGITLFEGETIRAVAELRDVAVPPPAPIVSIGFRFMGFERSKDEIEGALRLKRWNS